MKIIACVIFSIAIGCSNGLSSTLQESKAKPRSGILQGLLDVALKSPLWKSVLVPQARANIVKTAEANGIRWNDCLEWIKEQVDPNEILHNNEIDENEYPAYYKRPFHAYENGNLCWDAAFEQEIASRAVGARNFPTYGEKGEDAFRSAFDEALFSLGAKCPSGGTILDFGCGTGTGTRRLAARWLDASKIIGIDLSPYYIVVGRKLLELAPKSVLENGDWVTTIRQDDRIDLRVGDATNTGLPDNSVSVVNVGLVVHELPIEAACSLCDEALRVLKPGGQLWLYEMDFDSPGFSKQRSNPLLFSLIRSTEPWLDIYADGCDALREHICSKFETIRITAATGRHYALVATKGPLNSNAVRTVEDMRFKPDGTYSKDDTHLKTWESKDKVV
mmetsp:Transcript_29371/g.43121  ORF Transcript_29371/g.43121 Transcript_29371/m.43121 type:complete len:390 (-) Transcript_29371:106-1275(-)